MANTENKFRVLIYEGTQPMHDAWRYFDTLEKAENYVTHNRKRRNEERSIIQGWNNTDWMTI